MDGWTGMTNREEQEVQRRGRENRKRRLASSEISIRIHHERGRRMAPAARDDDGDDDILSDSPTLPERQSGAAQASASGPKLITCSLLSPSVCLKLRKSRGEVSTACPPPSLSFSLPHFPKMG